MHRTGKQCAQSLDYDISINSGAENLPKLNLELNKVELVAKIREQHHNLPVIVCSAYKGMKADQDLEYYNVSAFMDSLLTRMPF